MSWFVFRRSLLCFLVFRCSIFKVRSPPLFATACIVYHTSSSLSSLFLKFFQLLFDIFPLGCFCRRSVNAFLDCSSRAPLAEPYYITTSLSFCQYFFEKKWEFSRNLRLFFTRQNRFHSKRSNKCIVQSYFSFFATAAGAISPAFVREIFVITGPINS